MLLGVIPAQLASLQSLSSLNLDGNTLAGSIPPEISTMTGLVTLDLSCNKLIGASESYPCLSSAERA